MNEEQIKVKRSKRKSFSIELGRDGIVVCAPLRATDAQIRAVIEQNRDWIEKHIPEMRKMRERLAEIPTLTADELRGLADKALQYIPERVKFYAPMVGVSYGRITIRSQRTKWGSCSSRGNLNFNCLLMLCPPEVIDCVVVHELCHLKELNHSKRFYAEVLRVFPEYHRWNAWLKEHGAEIMERLPR